MNNHEDILCHYGTKGQKWGIRRWQNQDGTLTVAGKIRYARTGQKPSINDYEFGEWREQHVHGGGSVLSNDELYSKEEKNKYRADEYAKTEKVGEKEIKDLLKRHERERLRSIAMQNSEVIRNGLRLIKSESLKPAITTHYDSNGKQEGAIWLATRKR